MANNLKRKKSKQRRAKSKQLVQPSKGNVRGRGGKLLRLERGDAESYNHTLGEKFDMIYDAMLDLAESSEIKGFEDDGQNGAGGKEFVIDTRIDMYEEMDRMLKVGEKVLATFGKEF